MQPLNLLRKLWPVSPDKGGRSRQKASTRRRPLPRWRRRLHAATAAGAAVATIVLGAAWFVQAGHLARAVAAVGDGVTRMSVAAGLSVAEVYVTGRVQTPKDEVLAALAVERGTPMLAFDPDAARQRLLALDWVRGATVARRLPNLIVVHIEERRALAFWQQGGSLALIDREGTVITRDGLAPFHKLPIVVGEGAREQAAALIDMLSMYPPLYERVVAAVRVGERRWNVRLRNGIVVNLPEENPAEAWSRLAFLEAAHRIFERDIAVIDLRLPDRLVVRLTPEAAARRRDPGKST